MSGRASLVEALLSERERSSVFSEDSEDSADDVDVAAADSQRRERLRQRHHATVIKMFEDVQDVALSHLGVKHRDALTMPRLVRNYNFREKVGGQDRALERAVDDYHFQMRLCRKLKWGKMLPCWQDKFNDCNDAIFFRVKPSQKREASTSETANFPKSLPSLSLVETQWDASAFAPVDADVRGCWTGWTLTVNGHTFEGEMSRSFLMTFDDEHKAMFGIKKKMKYYAWSYPLKDWERAPDKLQRFFQCGGFMYFYRHGRKRRVLQLEARELGQIKSVKTGEPGDAIIIESEPPVWLSRTCVERQWNNMKEVTVEDFIQGGAKYFCWVAPGDRVREDEDCPLGFPHGGYLYLGNFQKNDVISDQDQNKCRDVFDSYSTRWWNDHLTALQRVVKRDALTRRMIEEEMIKKLRDGLQRLPASSSCDARRNSTLKEGKTLLDIVHRARYVFRFPEESMMFGTMYFSVFWFRFPFMFLMTSMLITAAFLGALMQVMFTVFGDIYDQGDPASFSDTAGEFIAFVLLPSLMVVCAILVDQIWDLIFSAFSPPYFVDFRARLLTVCMAIKELYSKQLQAPSHRLCAWVDYVFLLSFEGLPVLGALYNAVMLNLPMDWGVNFLPHFFYLGHMGKGDTILGGYLSGMMYNCLGMVIILTAVDLAYGILESTRPPERSLRFVSEKITAAMETYHVYPMSMRYDHPAFEIEFDTREASDFRNIVPSIVDTRDSSDDETTGSFWVGRYHEHKWKEASTQKNFWRVYKRFDLLIWYTPWFLMTLYLWSQALQPAGEPLFSSLSFLPDMTPWLVTAFFLGMATVRTSMVVEHHFPKLVGYTYRASLGLFFLVQLFLFFGGSGYYNPHKSQHTTADSQTLIPIMTVHSQGNGALSAIWPEPDPLEAQPYPICSMSWGDSDSSVSALDLAALSWIVYEKERPAIESLLMQNFGPGPQLVNFTNYEDIPRWIAVKFPPGWKHLGSNGKRSGGRNAGVDTVVVAVKGTSTFKDGYLDTDLFTTIQVLQSFEFIAPVLKILPVDMVQWLLKTVKFGTGGGKELGIWGKLNSKVTQLQNVEKANKRSTKFVLTGHSLGGGIAQIVAAQLGIKALVWSAPGTLYSQGFFSGDHIGSVSEERMQRNVVVVVPDNDGVPRVDSQQSVVQRIQCFGINHTAVHYMTGTKECHPIVKSACEVWRVCGDSPMHRDFSSACSKHVAEHELGKLYPVLTHPILGPNEEQ